MVNRDEFGFVDPDDYFPEQAKRHADDSNSYRSFEIPIDYTMSESSVMNSQVDLPSDLTREFGRPGRKHPPKHQFRQRF